MLAALLSTSPGADRQPDDQRNQPDEQELSFITHLKIHLSDSLWNPSTQSPTGSHRHPTKPAKNL